MSQRVVLELVLIGVASYAMSYIGAAVGLVLGHFRVVLLTIVLGSPVAGAATSMAVSTLSTLFGALGHARSGRVQGGPVLLIGIPSALAAYVAARYADRIEPRLLKVAIASTLVVAAIDLLRRHPEAGQKLPVPRWISPVVGQVVVGTVLGAVSGLVGLLLGTVRLPAMVRLGVTPATAIGTNMAIGALTGFFAGIAAIMGGHVAFAAFAVVAPLSIVGSYAGAKRTGRIHPTTLTRWIACALAVTAVILIGDTWWGMRHSG